MGGGSTPTGRAMTQDAMPVNKERANHPEAIPSICLNYPRVGASNDVASSPLPQAGEGSDQAIGMCLRVIAF